MIANTPFDVAILGGGLAGLTLAKQLLMSRPNTKVVIVERQRFPVPETTYKVGESTVEIGAHYFGEQLQLKKHLTDHQLPKFGLRFFFGEPHQTLSERTEVGGSEFFSCPSYQVDRGRLENHLAEEVSQMGATLWSGARLQNVELVDSAQTENPNHRVIVVRDDIEQTIDCRWLVDASGRASFLKRKLDLEEDLKHDINAVWFRLDESIQIDRWCEDTEWRGLTGKVPRRWLSTNHLMGTGYWVWLIPLATGSTSIGIVADPRIHPLNTLNSFDKAMNWLEQHEPECFDAIDPHRDKMQDFLAIKKMSRGTRQVYSADRWAMTGEAAAFLDPFYSPGSDFIAIGNTMIGKMIEDDLDGHSIKHLAPTLQSVYLTLFQNNLLTYRDQYPLFGNPRIMALKFVWDYAVYWGFPALLYFNSKLTDAAFIQSLARGVEEIRDMNLKMQGFFRDWYTADPMIRADQAFVDQSQIDIMTRLNAELTDKVNDQQLRARFESNVALLRNLMLEIVARIKQVQPDVDVEIPDKAINEHYLEGVFATLNM